MNTPCARAIRLGAALAAALLLGGCGSSEPPPPREEDKALLRAIQEPQDKARDAAQQAMEASKQRTDEALKAAEE